MRMFDWVEYLELAGELAERRESEAALRSAVSRAYYAVFCKARQTLRDQGFIVPRRGAHQFVWEKYQNHRERSHRRIGLHGERLKNYREDADYEETATELVRTVEDSLERAREVIHFLRNLPLNSS